MDYLDPKKKNQHKKRLMIGYGLMAIVIVLMTLILQYIAGGYFIDKNGQLIQNGLLYITTEPGDATVFLDGQKQRDTTESRLVIPAGNYTVEIQKPGYRPWSQKVEVEGAGVRRLFHPRLFPEKITTNIAQTFEAGPRLVAQSVDRKFIFANFASNPSQLLFYNTESISNEPSIVDLPLQLLPTEVDNGELSFIEWSDDNKYLLISYRVEEKVWFIVLNREAPAESLIVNNVIAKDPTKISLINRKFDQWHVFDKSSATLSRASRSAGAALEVEVTTVIDYRTVEDLVLYATPSDNFPDKTAFKIREKGRTYLIREISSSDSHLFDIARLGNAWLVAIASPSESKTYVYQNPTVYLRNKPDKKTPVPTTILKLAKPFELSFSTTANIVMVRNDSNFSVYDFENEENTSFELGIPLNNKQKLRWMDGHHLVAVQSGRINVFDYDGSNIQSLTDGQSEFGAFFDSDYKTLFAFDGSTSGLMTLTESSLK
jgi:PEGA domain